MSEEDKRPVTPQALDNFARAAAEVVKQIMEAAAAKNQAG